jgi:N-acyl-phosphatidylethanolamine-hydrolysing phospholipase D
MAFMLTGCASNNNASVENRKSHHTNDGFQNPYIDDPDKGLFDFLRMRFLGDEEWADHFALASTVNVQAVDIANLASPPNNQITWLGHSTFLVQHNKVAILTDPIFSDRASPTSFAGPQRYVAHAMDYTKLPPINWVVISHNHYDHLDTLTIRQLAKQSLTQASAIQFAVPLGLKALLVDNNIPEQNIHELDWWQKREQGNVLVEALPSQHWSSRSLSDMRQTLWASWAITIDGYKIWFAGDTGYNDKQFTNIGKHLGGVDLALIPIGAYAPRWFMKPYHVNPEEAINIHKDVDSAFSIGMHWGTFSLTAEAPTAPVEELAKQRVLQNVNEQAFITMDIGQTLTLPAR